MGRSSGSRHSARPRRADGWSQRRCDDGRRGPSRGGEGYVIRRIASRTFGRWRCNVPGGSIWITATAEGRYGWTDGPPRDPDRDTGSAARPRPRRAPARWIQSITDPDPALPDALSPRQTRPAHSRSPDGRGLPPPPFDGQARRPKRRRLLLPAPLRRVRAFAAMPPARCRLRPSTSFAMPGGLSHVRGQRWFGGLRCAGRSFRSADRTAEASGPAACPTTVPRQPKNN